MNFYNDNNPRAAAWLRDLISRGMIPDPRTTNGISPGLDAVTDGYGNAIVPQLGAAFIQEFMCSIR